MTDATMIQGVCPDRFAAVREALDGPEFCERVAAETGLQIRVLSGEEEAKYAAMGVLAGAPDDADALFHRGTALGRLGRLDEALDSFERLVRAHPGHAEGRRRHAQTLELIAQQPGRAARLTDALDAINDRFGKKTMVLAREGFAGEWRLRADHRSPRYTARISELPTVRV